MKALTAFEYHILNTTGAAHDRQMTLEEESTATELEKRGLLKFGENEDWLWIEPTQRGMLALRIHEAYLKSLPR